MKRVECDTNKVQRFYETALPRMEAIMAYLDEFELDTMPAPAKRLYYLALTCMEMSHPVDLNWRTTDIDDAFPSERVEFLPVERTT